ncbi:hypothetical protein AVEN_76552-1 [Araneus ventricosus]|uniref:Uncharacterized protein n=1 Tax=Araneus ventricosus TaxID=182803 RepID=A0A4Y2V139_ARAVE|nr:hypothetical protein AVEN_76552-1 [Araneus ventricosus]
MRDPPAVPPAIPPRPCHHPRTLLPLRRQSPPDSSGVPPEVPIPHATSTRRTCVHQQKGLHVTAPGASSLTAQELPAQSLPT